MPILIDLYHRCYLLRGLGGHSSTSCTGVAVGADWMYRLNPSPSPSPSPNPNPNANPNPNPLPNPNPNPDSNPDPNPNNLSKTRMMILERNDSKRLPSLSIRGALESPVSSPLLDDKNGSDLNGDAGNRSNPSPNPNPNPNPNPKPESPASASKKNADTLAQKLKDVQRDRGPVNMGDPLSPRTKYLAGCMVNGLNPRASLVLRKNLTKQLNLQHYGIGDEMAKIVAGSLVDMPFLSAVNIADNNLTDEGFVPLLRAISRIPSIVSLDISQNDCDELAANALSQYLRQTEPFKCPLIRLVSRHADVDDFECEKFVAALHGNLVLKDLDLSHNIIGSAENLNTVMPDVVTGGEALADLLDNDDAVLETLKIGWNMIRLDGAVELAVAIGANKSLTYLDMSYNALAHDGGLALGHSLLLNNVLRTLIISHNNLDASSCFTICSAIIQNHSITKLFMDGNPIGDVGAKALMRVASTVGGRVKVNANNCNISIKDEKAWFHYAQPINAYDLDMTSPYDRAVAMSLLQIVAAHHSYVFRYVDWAVGKNKQRINLKQVMIEDDEEAFDEFQRQNISGLRLLLDSASDINKAISLFQDVDEDGGGELDIDEFRVLLTRIGLEVDETRLKETMDMYDLDGGGSIGLPEFIMFMRAQKVEAEARLKDMIEVPIMCEESDFARGRKKRWMPPDTGRLHLEVVDDFKVKDSFKTMSSCDRTKIIEVARNQGDVSQMLIHALPYYKMRINEALSVYDTIMAEASDRAKTAAKVVLQLGDPVEARRFLMRTLGEDKIALSRVKRELGVVMGPVLGRPNGYYYLDLTEDIHRTCIYRLLETSQTACSRRARQSPIREGLLGDLSQKGNNTAFRNELFNGTPFILDAEWARNMPKYGIVEFDFSSDHRPDRNEIVILDIKFVRILVSHGLIDCADQMRWLRELRHLRHRGYRTAGGTGYTEWEQSWDEAEAVGTTIHNFYEHIFDRKYHLEKAIEKEIVRKEVVHEIGEASEFGNTPARGSIQSINPSHSTVQGSADRDDVSHVSHMSGLSTQDMASLTSTVNNEPDSCLPGSSKMSAEPSVVGGIEMTQSQHESDLKQQLLDEVARLEKEQEEKEKQRKGLLEQIGAGGNSDTDSDSDEDDNEAVAKWEEEMEELIHQEPPALDLGIRNLIRMTNSDLVNDNSKSVQLLEMIKETFERHTLYARQVAVLCEVFDVGKVPKTPYFGSYRTELVVSLFPRIIDIINLDQIMEKLTPYERGTVLVRVGWLKCFNPLKPEGTWCMDLSHMEERVVAKMLCTLSALEPGDNWPEKQFQWSRNMDPMPGWELTQGWMTEEGMPVRGILTVQYYSGEGKGLTGCEVRLGLRKALLYLGLIDEQDMCDEMDRTRETRLLEERDRDGLLYIKSNLGSLTKYILNNDEALKIVRKIEQAGQTAVQQALSMGRAAYLAQQNQRKQLGQGSQSNKQHGISGGSTVLPADDTTAATSVS